MNIRVRRETGLLGALTGVTLKVNGKEIKQLYREEEYVVVISEKEAIVQINQWFFGCRPLTVSKDTTIVVKTNYNCVALYILTFMFLFISTYSDFRLLKVVFSIASLLSLASVIFLSMRSWFVLSEIDDHY